MDLHGCMQIEFFAPLLIGSNFALYAYILMRYTLRAKFILYRYSRSINAVYRFFTFILF